jgi:peptide chain release factor subunit 1
VSPTLTQDVIRSLAEFKADGAAVVSLYLDVDGRRFVRPRDYEVRLDALVREARERRNSHEPADEDLERVTAHVKAGIDRSGTKGVALFSCACEGLWEVIELPVPVRNQLVVNSTPHIRQLEAILDENERFGVLLADRQRARMFVFELGELVDKTELFDELPRHEDDRGDWDRDHVRDHSAVAAQHHLRRAADVAFSVFQARGFDHLIIGAPDETARDLERELHSYLRERIAARLNVPVNSSEAAIKQAALEVEEQVERATEAALVGRLKDAVEGGRAGVAGLPGVLAALVERRVDTLLVSDGYEAPGWRCPTCRFMGTRGPRCPVCPASMQQVDDVVEEAVEEALQQSCRVQVVVGNADLDVLGRVAAILRF